MFKQNPATNVDSYKTSHREQYPNGLTMVYSNFTPRSNNHLNVPEQFKQKKEIVWFGLQSVMMNLIDLWNTEFFHKELEPMMVELNRRLAPFAGPNGFDDEGFRELHALGYLPIHINALPEAERVPIGVPCFVIYNTHPKFGWLTNYLETYLSCELWQMSTSATISDVYKQILVNAFEKTGADTSLVQFYAHDFSMRGQPSVEAAARSGAAHLLSFTGTDVIPAVDFLEHYYGARDTFVGCSVPATEHSIQCSGGKDDELETYRRLITTYNSGIISIVSDTWNLWDVIAGNDSIAATLKQEILARIPDQLGNAKVVFRPDSGDPVEIICGMEIPVIPSEYADTLEEAGAYAKDELVEREGEETAHGECGSSDVSGIFKFGDLYYNAKVEIEWNRYDKQYYYMDGSRLVSFDQVELTPEQKGAVTCLDEIFGTTTNEKGFKTLNQRVGLIYGDSITPQRAMDITSRLAAKGYAADNCVLGVGSFSFVYNTRDSLGWAVKATYIEIDGIGKEIFKEPLTDGSGGMKKSAKGLLKVVRDDSGKLTLKDQQKDITDSGEMIPVFHNGVILKSYKLAELREKLAK